MLTPAQIATLRVAVLAEPTLADARNNGDDYAIAAWCNAVGSFIAWRTRVTQDEIMQNGFDWTRVDNLGVGKARIWEWLFDNEAAVFDPSKPNVRAGVEAVWTGTAADLAVRAAVYAHCKRAVTNAQRVLATGVGTNASPGTMTFTEDVSANEASLLR